MRILLQRVSEAKVVISKSVVGKIHKGLLLFVGVHAQDREEKIPWFANKILGLRVFSDELGKMNRSVLDVNGEILVVSQFTLYGNCKEGRRPSFTQSAPPRRALPLYEALVAKLKESPVKVATGVFGADMQVELTNDGPVTFVIED